MFQPQSLLWFLPHCYPSTLKVRSARSPLCVFDYAQPLPEMLTQSKFTLSSSKGQASFVSFMEPSYLSQDALYEFLVVQHVIILCISKVFILSLQLSTEPDHRDHVFYFSPPFAVGYHVAWLMLQLAVVTGKPSWPGEGCGHGSAYSPVETWDAGSWRRKSFSLSSLAAEHSAALGPLWLQLEQLN